MKVDAICQDNYGTTISVCIDLDYVNIESYDEVYDWCENALFEEQRHRFDVINFKILNYDSLYLDNIKNLENDIILDPFIEHEF